jgi:hypothetical protein
MEWKLTASKYLDNFEALGLSLLDDYFLAMIRRVQGPAHPFAHLRP